MSEAVLGRIPSEFAQRDAVHVAIVPCIAGEDLIAGTRVDVVNGIATTGGTRRLGIVDPFLTGSLRTGERCYVCLYPGSVVGMRHHWKHPAFLESSERDNALTTLASIAQGIGIPVEELLEDADNFLRHGEYRCEGGRFEGVWLDDTFWRAYEIVRECTVEQERRGGVYSCSC